MSLSPHDPPDDDPRDGAPPDDDRPDDDRLDDQLPDDDHPDDDRPVEGRDEAREAEGSGFEEDAADGEGPEDDAEDDGSEEGPETGYVWSFAEQEERLGDEYDQHMEILDDLEGPEILNLDLAEAGDYILWAAAQSLEEQEWSTEAIALLRRVHASTRPHPALDYAAIRLRLHDLLRDRGHYEEALEVLDRVESEHPDRRETCRERKGEVLILTGRSGEGLRLFEAAARAVPDDPWIPLAAAWALVRAGDYDGALEWVSRGERAARRLDDEEESRAVDTEIERLRNEARIRSERQARREREEAAASTRVAPEGEEGGSAPPEPGPGDPEALRQSILAGLDAEEVRLTRTPPRTEEEKADATRRLADLHGRASAAWDDAVERHDERAVAAFDDLQWEVVEVAERFGLAIPGVEE